MVIPLVNFAMRDLSSQLDPAKYQRMLFGLILVVMMIYRQQGLIPAKRRKRQQKPPEAETPVGPALASTEAEHGTA
jgi:branched-chain amino acid transport system permease protein